jgi:hypothetical protein
MRSDPSARTMTDPIVQLEEVPVLRLKADFQGKGPAAAFSLLETKLPSLKGRRFYGTFRFTSSGPEYYACVGRLESDDPEKMGLESSSIPGGSYARRKLMDWKSKLSELPGVFQEMGGQNDVDPARPSVEFYRSQQELHLLMPVRGKPSPTAQPG